MELTPDQIVWAEWGPARLNATIVFTWAVNALLVGVSVWVARRWRDRPRRTQLVVEVLLGGVMTQLEEVTQQPPRRFLPFVGSLFLFIAVSNALTIVPYYSPPTASLSTTVALALCVLVMVPAYGIAAEGLRGYLRHYVEPSPLMLPFNILGELSRTVALAVRLFGNMMSGTLIAAILLSLAPFFFPVVMQALGLLTGLIQAYIFAVLAAVYLASATRAHEDTGARPDATPPPHPTHSPHRGPPPQPPEGDFAHD